MIAGNRWNRIAAGTALLLAFGISGLRVDAQDKVVVPKAGDPIRKTLFNVMRPAFEKDLKQKVIFQVDDLRMLSGWAFIKGKPRQPDQSAINYKKTRYQSDIKEGMFDDWYCALLHKVNGNWKLVTYQIGATDVAYAGWAKQYHAPKSIIPYNE